jgi:hypothetical protein
MPPEGLDQAADAFRTEIAPESPRPRDDSGRFAPRPESMFAPRPIEGEDRTQSTREDQRLAERERRIADGRAEERDEEPVRDAPARARPAAGDDRHDEQSGEGDEGTDEPASKTHEGAEEPQDLEDGESRFKITTLDGKPVEKFEVQVDGQPVEVSLDEALRGYVREKTFHQRMTKIDQARQTVEQQFAETGQVRQHYIQQCEHLARMLQEVLPPPPNWDEERRRDPQGAWDRRQAYEAVYGKIHALNQQAQAAQEQARQEYDRNSQRYAVEQFSQFVQEANIPDEKALSERLTRMRAYGRRMGFHEGELATVYDKRMLRVLDHAAKYDQMMADRPKAVIPGKGKTLTPGVATPSGNATRRSLDEAQQRLAKTGRLDDAASVFQRLLR